MKNQNKERDERTRKSIAELWQESDRITQDIISHPWKYPLQYLIMRLGRFPDKRESK